MVIPNRRVRTGCGTCRKRRIKCDENKPSCMRCRGANFECDGYEPPRKAGSPQTKVKTRQSSSPSPPSTSASPSSDSSRHNSLSPELPSRRFNWRQEQLPLYHHFITSTVFRLFRDDHVMFWRDEVAQMSYEVDMVYEALLAISAAHRATLLSCAPHNAQEVTKWKIMGLSAYGNSVRSIACNGCNMLEAPIPALKSKLIALMLLAYFECFMQSQKGVFRHLWAAIQVLQIFQERASPADVKAMAPVQEVILRLDFLAQKLIPFAQSSLLRGSTSALMQTPFWNRSSLEFSGGADSISTEGNNLIRLVGGHNHINRVVWGPWYPISERASRDELMGFYTEMLLWKATSPATFSSCPALDDIRPTTIAEYHALPMPPQPLIFSSAEAALNVVMFNGYLGCSLAMISTTDDDPAPRELEMFRLAYQNLSIAAGLLNLSQAPTLNSYHPCEALSTGISLYLYHQSRRVFSTAWQQWTATALRKIGHEGLLNANVLATTLDIMDALSDPTPEGNNPLTVSPLGPIRDRLVPMLLPEGENGLQTAFYLRYGTIWDGTDESVVRVVAKATWRQSENGVMENLQLDTYLPDDEGAPLFSDIPKSPRRLSSWRNSVEPGWHGVLSAASFGGNEVGTSTMDF